MRSSSTQSAGLSASLRQIGLYTPDVSRLADFYAASLGFRFEASDRGRLGTALGRRIELIEGPAKSLAYAVFALPDGEALEHLVGRLHAAACAFDRIALAGFLPDAVRLVDPDGNCFIFAVEDGAVLQHDTPRDRAARVQHVVFASTRLQELLQFYTDVLGFRLSDRVNDADGNVRTVFLRCGEEHHSLAVFAASEARLDHHCYEAGDWGLLRDWADHFASIDVPLKWGPGRHGPGNNLFIFIHDPDGNWLEVSAELEVVDERRPVGDWPHTERTLNQWGMGLLRS